MEFFPQPIFMKISIQIISDNHFCTIGNEDEFSLKFNNDTGEVYIYDYESNTYNKTANSICEIILMMKSIWRKHEN